MRSKLTHQILMRKNPVPEKEAFWIRNKYKKKVSRSMRIFTPSDQTDRLTGFQWFSGLREAISDLLLMVSII